MNYLQVENLTKSFGELLLFEDISFTIDKDQKVAIIAKNGTGKTSLLNIITGFDTPDDGQVTFKNNISFGYLEQNPKVDNNKTVMEQVFASSNEIVEVVRNYENALKSTDEKLLEEAIEQMDFHKAWDYDVQIKTILTQLKINNFNQKVGELSGGQKKRLALANLLINEPNLLILDEPTNHLDVELIEWLEEYLTKTKSTLLMVTHDRYFLDRVCNQILEIDNNTVYNYNGNYSFFLEKREERVNLHNLNIDKAKNLFKQELEWSKRMPKARTGKAKYRMDNVKKLEEKAHGKIVEKNININVQTQRIGKKILELKNIYKNYDDLKIIEDFSYRFTNGEKIGIVGNNGVGKSTFLNIITQNLKPNSGEVEIGQTITFGYYKQTGLQFDNNKRVIDIISEVADIITLGDGTKISASRFLELFLFPQKTHYSSVEKLSGGEKKRLFLMTVLMKNPNFLILDEPTNDLDIMTLSVLEDYLQNFNGCVLIVSHDRYFMDKLVDSLFVFEGNGIVKSYTGKYSEYHNFKKTKELEEKNEDKKEKPKKEKPKTERSKKLSFNQKRLFEQLEIEIPELQNKKEEIENILSSGTLNHEKITEKAEELIKIKDELDNKEMQWLELSEIED
ncbi:MAG: ABC-F family ATP-binding cassette domain-containing protein [Bacteroidales bacterium]|nr:ABC-F family ATP-binding cassette domain-containing protein [Bacteroidales bacterium]